MIDRLALILLIAGCVLLTVIVAAEIRAPARPEAQPSAAPTAPDPAPIPLRRDAAGRYQELLTTALARPLFSSTRRPPPQGGTDAAADTGLADTRLTGIVTEPGHRIAIFAPAGAKALIVTEGESVSGWRVDTITPTDVSLTGPSGTKTLQPKIDPNLVPPAGPPTAAPANAPAPPPVAAVGPRPGLPPAMFNRPPPRPGQRRGLR